jgi:hypothetical protein
VKDGEGVSKVYGYFQRSVGLNERKPHPAVMLCKKEDYWIALRKK